MHHDSDTRPSGNVTWYVLLADMVKETVTVRWSTKERKIRAVTLSVSPNDVWTGKNTDLVKGNSLFLYSSEEWAEWLKACIKHLEHSDGEHRSVEFSFSFLTLSPSPLSCTDTHTNYILYLFFPPFRFFLRFHQLYSYYTAEGKIREN